MGLGLSCKVKYVLILILRQEKTNENHDFGNIPGRLRESRGMA